MKHLSVIITVAVTLTVGWTTELAAQSSIGLPELWVKEDQYGNEAAAVGDIDGDGLDDAVVRIGASNSSEVQVFRGSSVGLKDDPAKTIASPLAGNQTAIRFGQSIEAAGDVDGDGFADVIIGDPLGEIVSNSPPEGAGRAYVYRGRDDGLHDDPDWTAAPTGSTVSKFGYVVSGAGDVDGDGYDDVIVGDPGFQSFLYCAQRVNAGGSGDGGSARLYRGGSNGLSGSADWEFSWQPSSSQAGACLGYTVSGVGDVNGDGYDDVAVSAPLWRNSAGKAVGKLFVFYGSSSGLADSPDWSVTHPQLATSEEMSPWGDVHFGRLGWSVDGGGDLNGDGFADLVVAGRGFYKTETGQSEWSQRIFVYYGGSNGLPDEPDWSVGSPGGPVNQYRPNTEVSLSGDVNNDGFHDLVVPLPVSSSMSPTFDKLALYPGASAGLSSSGWQLDHTDYGLQQNQFNPSHTTDLGGDYDGDGRSDLLKHISRPDSQNTTDLGLHVFTGGPNPAPVAQAQSVSVRKGETVEVALEGSDPFDDPLTYAISVAPEEGSLSGLDDQQGTVTYEAPAAFVGDDPFDFEVEDDKGGTDTATVDVTVTNGAPVFEQPPASASYETVVGEEVTFPIEVSEPDGDSVTRRATSFPDGANIDWDDGREPGEFSWTPSADQTGDHQVVLEADDTFEVTMLTVTIAVQPQDSDGDGVPDPEDACPDTPADTDDGCPPGAEPDPMADIGVDNDTGNQSDDERETQTSGCGCGTRGPASGGGLPAGVVWVVLVASLWRARGNRESASTG